jgi:EAL domain-containing protein (putative c-di-GMP-specific phosphodiesterase class I)
VETEAEMRMLAGMGVSLMQGYLFARPQIEALPKPVVPAAVATDTF